MSQQQQQQQQPREEPPSSYPTTTTTNLRGATPRHDCHPAAAGQYYVPSTAREPSRGRKTSSI